MSKAIIIILMGLLLAPSVLANKTDKYIAKANKHLPYMVDKQTQLNEVIKLDDNTAELVHILINYKAEQIDINNFKSVMPSILYKNACKDKIVKRAFKRNISAVYTYYTNDGIKIASFNVNKEFCND